MKFFDFFIHRPVATTLLTLGIALSGVIGYRSAEHVAFWWRHLKRGTTPGGREPVA